jgi:amino acid transporter
MRLADVDSVDGDDDDSVEDDESTGLLSNGRSNGFEVDGHLAWEPSKAANARPALSVLGVAAISYFTVSGGPFGLEVAIGTAGPQWVIISILTLVLIWSVPCALMTAELSSALPSRGGYIHWVDRGLGERFGTITGLCAVFNQAVDSSTYPAIFCDYLVFTLQRYFGQPTMEWGTRFATSAALVFSVCGLNMRGISLAARASVVLAIFSLTPFAVMLLLAPFTNGSAAAGEPPATHLLAADAANATSSHMFPGGARPDFLLLLSLAMWTTSGFDAVSLVSSEVPKGQRSIPKALGLSLSMMLTATLLPLLACCSEAVAGPQKWSSWKLGAFALAAERVGGVPLGTWMCLAAMGSSAGLLNAFMCTSARSVQAMACKGLLPATLRKEMGPERTPGYALMFTSTCILCLLSLPFSHLIELDMSLYACSLSMELLSLLRLRWTEPELRRPYRVPLGRRALCLMCTPPLLLCALILSMSLRNPSMRSSWAVAIGLATSLYNFGPRCFRPRDHSVR